MDQQPNRRDDLGRYPPNSSWYLMRRKGRATWAKSGEVAIVEAEEIDRARMDALTSAAGSRAFTRSVFPRNLFEEIAPTTDTLRDFTLNVNGLTKGSYTNPPMVQAAVNEEEWWRDSMSRQVAAVVWGDVVSNAAFQELEGRTPDEFWSAVRDGSARIRGDGRDPLLVVGHGNDPDRLLGWRLPYRDAGVPKPADLVITREEGQVDGYFFTMNDTPVYLAAMAQGVAYLIPKQLRHRLRYHDYGNGQAVSLQFESDPDNPWQGTMHAIFQREVELRGVESYRIRWKDAANT